MSGRRTTLGAAAVLGLTLLVPAAGATAAGETCRGEAATIVGTGPTVTGTEGRDVIVTALSTNVDALGGDDLICVAFGDPPRSNVLFVDAGTGDDVVDTTGATSGYYTTVTLGAGADTFVGGASGDSVWTGSKADPPADAEADVVSTGDGDDAVVTGAQGLPNHDRVVLGAGTDRVYLASTTIAADGLLDGGSQPRGSYDGDVLSLEGTRPGDLALDMAAGTFTAAGSTTAFAGFEDAEVTTGSQRLSYHGTDGDDILTVHTASGATALFVAMLAGDDHLFVEPADVAAGSAIDTGAGTDEVVIARKEGTLGVDLARRRLDVAGAVSRLAGPEHAFLMAPEVSLVGDRHGNDLLSNSCDATVEGGPGNDYLRNVKGDPWFEEYRFTCRPSSVVRGGSGADRLVGSGGSDRLHGDGGRDRIEGRGGNDLIRGGRGNDVMDGSGGRDVVRGDGGRDVADGGPDRDTCVAERERSCER